MNPDSFILVEALNQGVERMKACGFIKFSIACEKVKTRSGEQLVPALVSVGPDSCTFLTFFIEQVSTKKGGSSKYLTLIKKSDVADLTQPPAYEIESEEDQFFRWTA